MAGVVPESQLSARREPQQLVFHPKEPPRLLRRVVDASMNVVLIAVAIALLASGSPSPFVVAGVTVLAVAVVARIAAWAAYRRDPSSHRHDPRREVVLSASLVGRARSLQAQDRRGEAAKLLQGETDLSVADTARALRLVRESGTPR